MRADVTVLSRECDRKRYVAVTCLRRVVQHAAFFAGLSTSSQPQHSAQAASGNRATATERRADMTDRW